MTSFLFTQVLQYFFDFLFFHKAEGTEEACLFLILVTLGRFSYFAVAFIIVHAETTMPDWSKLPVNSGMFRFEIALPKISLKILQSFLPSDTFSSFSTGVILTCFFFLIWWKRFYSIPKYSIINHISYNKFTAILSFCFLKEAQAEILWFIACFLRFEKYVSFLL